MKIICYQNVFLTRSGIGLKRFRLIDETIHQYPGKRKGFLKYAVLQFLFRKKIKLKGNFFVVHNHWCPGYYHWITEALPRLLHANEHIKDHVLLLPQSFRSKLEDSVTTIFKGDIYWIPQNKNLVIENLLIPENPPYCGMYDVSVFESLRRQFIIKLPQKVDTRSHSKIYVSRALAARRKVVNEDEVVEMLRPFGYIVVDFDEITFWQQVSLMQQVKTMISIHGAGLSNMLFMAKGSNVIELQKEVVPDKEQMDTLYKNFAEILEINYMVQFCKSHSMNSSIYDADIVVDLNVLQSLVKSLES